MNENTQTIPEAAVEIGLAGSRAYSRTDSGNWRLMQAIDILLDYLMVIERKQEDDQQPDNGARN